MTIWRWAFREATEAALIGGALGPSSFSARFRRLGWFLFQMGVVVAIILGISFYVTGPMTGDPGENLVWVLCVCVVLIGFCGFGLFMVFLGAVVGFLFRR